jgi:hypothetical protein
MSPQTKILLVAAVCCIIFNEVLLYVFAMASCGSWLEPTECTSTPEGCHHILLISDPQLQGELWEHPLLQTVTIPDADFHMWKVYQLVLFWLHPSLVIILGDLLDEGFPASDTKFQQYVSRFWAIFRTPSSIPIITLPGDNDIGGEGSDRMTTHILRRFEASFGKANAMVSTQGLQFLKLELLSMQTKRERPEFKAATMQLLQNVSNTGVERGPPPIILSHLPLIGVSKVEQQMILKATHPRFLFTGHTHQHAIHRYETLIGETAPIEEHVVPTISYRMGTAEVGVALASISTDGLSLGYKECWFPSRYPSFGVYAVLAVILGACSIKNGLKWVLQRSRAALLPARAKARRY